MAAEDKLKLNQSNVNTTARTVTIGTESIGIPGTSGGSGVTLAGHSVTELDDVSAAGSGQIITATERTKLTNINVNTSTRDITDGTNTIEVPPANAEQNVNADWDATSGDAQILNKPGVNNFTVVDGSEDLVTGNAVFDYLGGRTLGDFPVGDRMVGDFNNDAGYITEDVVSITNDTTCCFKELQVVQNVLKSYQDSCKFI